MKTPTPDPREELANISPEHLNLFVHVAAVRQTIEQMNAAVLLRAASSTVESGFPLKIGNAAPFIRTLIVEDHSALAHVLDVLEASPAYAAARAAVEPILARCERAEAAEVAHQEEIGARTASLRAATAAAQARAALAANRDAAVIAARRALQEAELSHVGGIDFEAEVDPVTGQPARRVN